MTKTVLAVDDMFCEHCVNTITKAVGALNGVSAVAVDLSAKTVTVEHDSGKASIDKIKLEIENQGFEVND
ncbi:MAG: copper ion binding protein [Firmicutes bacterium]|nr:copper ion binding protein [Bacillota bacterium]